MKEPEKKVDQSWKERVERERDHEKVGAQPPPPSPSTPKPDQEPPPPTAKPEQEPTAAAADDEQHAAPGPDSDLGPASLQALVTQLAMQAMFSLGLVQTPDGQVPEPDLDQSRYLIDLVELLEDKTAGNVTEDEQKLLSNTLHDLRMAYVSVSRR